MQKNYIFEGEKLDDFKKVIGYYVFGLEDGKKIHTIVNQTKEQEQTGEFTSYIVKPDVKYLGHKNKYAEFMLQQLLGYRLGKERCSIRDLIISAGLTKKEWFNIKDEIDCKNLCESDKLEIEEYVNNLS